jgi:hypothetical protein
MTPKAVPPRKDAHPGKLREKEVTVTGIEAPSENQNSTVDLSFEITVE